MHKQDHARASVARLAFHVASGAQVSVIDIAADGLHAPAQELPGIKTAVYDVSSRADVERVVPEAIETLRGLDVLVSSAGISCPTAPVGSFDPDA
jgi:NAD(P)-dependent dehydrogenase (short-subunit alcohol dehydrogenase family)